MTKNEGGTPLHRYRDLKAGEDKTMLARNVETRLIVYTGVCRRRSRVARGEETQQYTAKSACVRVGNSACCRLLIARMALAKPLITHERVISYPLLGVRRTSALIAALAAGHNEGPLITRRALRDRMKLLRRYPDAELVISRYSFPWRGDGSSSARETT